MHQNIRLRQRKLYQLSLAVGLAAAVSLSGKVPAQNQLDHSTLEHEGNWLIFRHAAKGQLAVRNCSHPPPPTRSNCGGQDVLTRKGIEAAFRVNNALIGEAGSVDSNIHTVYSSSCSRTLETAKLIAGDEVSVEPLDNLRLGDSEASANLRNLLSDTDVPTGKNNVVVTHSTVIAQAFNINLDYADAVVVRGESMEVLGKIDANSWPITDGVRSSLDQYCQ